MTNKAIPVSTDIERDPTHLAAADWLVRLQSTDVSIEDTLAWQAWLNENPTNAQAFARIEEISQVLRDVPAPSAVSARQFARDRYDASVPIKDWGQSQVRRPWTAIAVAATFAILTVTFLFGKTPPAANCRRRHRTRAATANAPWP